MTIRKASIMPGPSPEPLIDAALPTERQVLLFGAPGVGKSTLAGALARALGQVGRRCACIGADPGSPAFGIPGALCYAEWQKDAWQLLRVEAVCTLDAGRFRLPWQVAGTSLGDGRRQAAWAPLAAGAGVRRQT